MPKKKSRAISRISYLTKGGKREAVQVGDAGKIRFGSYKPIAPQDFVRLFFVQGGDPVLTLKDGDKLRVYYGGDPTQMSAQAQGVMENHAAYYETLYRSSPDDTLEIPFDWVWDLDADIY